MKKILSIFAVSLLLTSCTPISDSVRQEAETKLFVAIEGENRIAVLDPTTHKILKTINLSERADGMVHEFTPHNVQVAPDGKSIWVTANHGHGDMHEEENEHGESDAHKNDGGQAPDQIIVIDPITETIIKRIPTNLGLHLAHVVVTKDGSFAYATAQTKGIIYKINAQRFEIAKEIMAPGHSEPHGLRLSADGTKAYIALLQGKELGILDLTTDILTTIPLDGNAVQTAVTPDGKLILVSLYDTKKLAVVDTTTNAVTYIPLPQGSKGPIQLYPTPDSRFVYIADQGYYFEQSTGNRVYKIDLLSRYVVKEILVGDAPHGVVVSPDGKFVYVTNLLTQDVSIIDTVSDTEVKRVHVGTMPNGISLWSRSTGGTP